MNGNFIVRKFLAPSQLIALMNLVILKKSIITRVWFYELLLVNKFTPTVNCNLSGI